MMVLILLGCAGAPVSVDTPAEEPAAACDVAAQTGSLPCFGAWPKWIPPAADLRAAAPDAPLWEYFSNRRQDAVVAWTGEAHFVTREGLFDLSNCSAIVAYESDIREWRRIRLVGASEGSPVVVPWATEYNPAFGPPEDTPAIRALFTGHGSARHADGCTFSFVDVSKERRVIKPERGDSRPGADQVETSPLLLFDGSPDTLLTHIAEGALDALDSVFATDPSSPLANP